MLQKTIPSNNDIRQARRSERFAARHVLWNLSHKKRRRECGFKCRSADGVAVRVTNNADGSRHAGYAGLSSCASVWSCPVCSATIANARQTEIEAALVEWTRRGGRVVLGTVTMRHHARHELGELWDGLSDAKHVMLSGRGWQDDQGAAGILMPRTIKTGKRAGEVVWSTRVPVISVVEVTYGVNGWHVHLHMLLLVSGDVDAGGVATMGGSMFERWADALEARGLPRPNLRHGKDFRLLEGDPSKALGEYFTKSVYTQGESSVLRAGSMETARGDFKDGKFGNRTPFGILRGLVSAVLDGDLGARSVESIEVDEQIWHDWEEGSAGRRQIAWSAGLREWLAVVPVVELTDEEILEEVEHDGDETHTVDASTWGAVRRARAGARLLDAFEVSADEGELLLARFERAGYEHDSRRLLLV